MEQSDDQVRLLVPAEVINPLAGTSHHFLKVQAAPQRLVEPVGNGRCQHAENGNTDALPLHDGVGGHVGLSCMRVDDVGTKHGTLHLADPLVIDVVPGFHVVVAEGLCVVLQVVDDLCRDVRHVRLHIIIIVADGLSLQDVAVVQQHHGILAVLTAQLLDKRADACHRTGLVTIVEEVEGHERAMHVRRAHDV